MNSVFISHSWHDKKIARKIANDLKKNGVKVWIDEAEIKLGDSLIDKIREGIDRVDFLIALVSKKSVSSEWVRKELDIAMNQEIAGRRVKVLPILIDECELPNFLMGKLYADMSTAEGYKKAIPMILDRLGFNITIDDFSQRKYNIDKITENLSTNNEIIISEVLNELIEIDGRGVDLLLRNPRISDLFIELALNNKSVSIRLSIIKLLCKNLRNNVVDEIITQMIYDENPIIVNCILKELHFGSAVEYMPYERIYDRNIFGEHILKLLKNTENPSVKIECINYFKNIPVKNDFVIISLVEYIKRYIYDINISIEDKLRYLEILGTQWDGFADSPLDILIGFLDDRDSSIRTFVIDVISKGMLGGSLSGNPEINNNFSNKYFKLFTEVTSGQEKAKLILLGFLIDGFNHDRIWKALLNSDEITIECLSEELLEFKLHKVFDQPEDVEYMVKCLEANNSRPRELILSILANVRTKQALDVLAKEKYVPIGWNAVYVLLTIAKQDFWDITYKDLLKSAKNNIPEYAWLIGKVFSLFSDLKANNISIDIFLEDFPDNNKNEGYQPIDEDKKIINELLCKLKGSYTGGHKNKIIALIRKWKLDSNKHKKYS